MALTPADHELIATLRAELGAGDRVTPERWAALAARERPHLAAALGIAGAPANQREIFSLIRDGDAPPLSGPRWWFHLLGPRHGAVHVALTTPQGWLVAQRRSRAKDSSPGAVDLAVTGHTGTQSPLAAAWREMGEELGLGPAEIAGGELTPVMVYDDEDGRPDGQPPYLNRERRWVYMARLAPGALDRLRFADGEVTALLLLGPVEVAGVIARIQAGQVVAPDELPLARGIVATLARWPGGAGAWSPAP